jgi:hypothetical protein
MVVILGFGLCSLHLLGSSSSKLITIYSFSEALGALERSSSLKLEWKRDRRDYAERGRRRKEC